MRTEAHAAGMRFLDGSLVTDAYLARLAEVIDEIIDIEDEFPDYELEDYARRARASKEQA